MANIYSGILSGMTDAFASVISNNLNIVMKFLATVTIVMSIPTMIFSAYGMNVKSFGMPFCRQSVWICHCNCAVFDTKSDCGNYFFKERPVLGFIPLNLK